MYVFYDTGLVDMMMKMTERAGSIGSDVETESDVEIMQRVQGEMLPLESMFII